MSYDVFEYNGIPDWRHSGVFIVNFEHISHLFLGFLLLTLNKQMLRGIIILKSTKEKETLGGNES